MLAALSNERAAALVAFEHIYISPFGVHDIGMIFGDDDQPIQALVTPRYPNGDILKCVNRCSYAPRLSWVSFGFYTPLLAVSIGHRSSKLQWLSSICICTM